jgi:hypothetical protein
MSTSKKYTQKDARRDTLSGRREVSEAFHAARKDSGVHSGKDSEALKVNAIERDLAGPSGILDWLFGKSK